MLLFRVTVSGESMWPTLTPGQTYWASSLLPIRVGSIAIVHTPHRTVIKFIESISGNQITLRGTHTNTDPMIVDRKQIVGRLFKY